MPPVRGHGRRGAQSIARRRTGATQSAVEIAIAEHVQSVVQSTCRHVQPGSRPSRRAIGAVARRPQGKAGRSAHGRGADGSAEGHRQGRARDGDARADSVRDPAIFEPLVQALKDSSPDVREQAARGLGQLRDRRARRTAHGCAEGHERRTCASRRSQLRDARAFDDFAAIKDVNVRARDGDRARPDARCAMSTRSSRR